MLSRFSICELWITVEWLQKTWECLLSLVPIPPSLRSNACYTPIGDIPLPP